MARLPVLKPREIAHVLEKMGFVEVRQRGSHKQYRHGWTMHDRSVSREP
jgi:predicted RNA binding protein YcfA (HicA-like mRNA interferase family)